MDEAENRPLIKVETSQLTWRVQIRDFPEPFSELSSPLFETAVKAKFRIILKMERYADGDDLFCTLRTVDSDAVYSVLCSFLFLPEDGGNGKQMGLTSVHKGTSKKVWQLCASEAHNNLSSPTVKLVIKFRLLRRLLRYPRIKSLSVVTNLQPYNVSLCLSTENVIYPGKKNECILEEPNKYNNHADESREEGFIHYHNFDSSLNGWFYIRFIDFKLDLVSSFHWHILDVNDHIHASADPLKFEWNPENLDPRVHIIKNEDLWKKRELLSRDGEINLFCEWKEFFKEINHISQEWSSLSRRNGGDLRNDLERYLQGPPKGSNLEIRSDGAVHKVHNYVMGARSPVFSAMLSTDMIEKNSKVVNIKDFDSVTLKNFLDYIYFGKFENGMMLEEIERLYTIAKKYWVKSLCHVCIFFCFALEDSGEISAKYEIF